MFNSFGITEETLITHVVNCKKAISAKVIYKSEFWSYFIQNHLRLKKMDGLENACYFINSKTSYTTYNTIRQCLDDFGYGGGLRDDSGFARYKSILGLIVAQRFKFSVHHEKRAVLLEFVLFFGQINYWISKKDYTFTNFILEGELDFSKLIVKWTTDGTPSSNRKKPFLVFGVTFVYDGHEMAFTKEKVRFWPLVIQYSKESSESFDYWGNKVKIALKESEIPDSAVMISMDGGAWGHWVGLGICPFCQCGGYDEWATCSCDAFKLPSESCSNEEFWKQLIAVRDKLKPIDNNSEPEYFDNSPMFSSLTPEQLKMFEEIPINTFKSISDSCKKKSEAITKLLETQLHTNITVVRLRDLLKPIIQDLPCDELGKVLKKKPLLEYAKNLKMKLREANLGTYNAAEGKVDQYWLERFMICIMHGRFRLAVRQVMLLYNACKDSSFYFPRFLLAMKVYSIHFNIYTCMKTKKEKLSPLGGHDTDRFFECHEKLIAYCLPPEELMDSDINIDKMRSLLLVRNIKFENSDTLFDLHTKFHISNKNHRREVKWKRLFDSAIKHFATVQYGFCKDIIKGKD